MDLVEGSDQVQDFSSFDLDARLTRVLQRQNIVKPTLIQEKAIPLALLGKDLLAKAKTGSGKTLAYLLPILQRILTSAKTGGVQALILVPTKELARQVTMTAVELLHYCPREVVAMNLAGEESMQLQRSMLSTAPSILVSTPSRLLPHLDAQAISLKESLQVLVIDEADLVLSFGYTQEVERLAREHLPTTVQTLLMSATLSVEMDGLKQLVLRNPVILKLEEGEDEGIKGDAAGLQQYVIRCEADDKFLVLYVVIKLKLLRGKLLIFANDVDCCFRLKLFLEQFGIKTCLLNPELPLVSRHHIVDEYNRGVYDIILASDSTSSVGKVKRMRGAKGSDSKEGGVARGIDFRHVDVVINFDFPLHTDTYVHRVGRTARGGSSGTAMSFVSSSADEKLLAAVTADQLSRGASLVPHDFDLKQLDGFRYRCNDALRSVTKAACKSARLQAIKSEIVKSEKLKAFFAERPKDLQLLRHDKHSGVVATRPHLKHVPDYLLASSASNQESSSKRVKMQSLPQAEPARASQPLMPRKKTFSRSKDPLRAVKTRPAKK